MIDYYSLLIPYIKMTAFIVLAILGLGALIFICGGYISHYEKPDDGTDENAVPVDVKTETLDNSQKQANPGELETTDTPAGDSDNPEESQA